MTFRRILIATVLVGLISISLVPSSSVGKADSTQPGQIFSSQIQEMLNQIDPGEISNLTKNLSGEQQVMISGEPYTIETRSALSGEPNSKAVQYLFEFYQNLGLQVSLKDFSYRGQILSNVIAEKNGTIFPERIFMLTSHLDDVPISGKAPGADDNASGTVGVMLAAEVLNSYEFGCTLRFANFNAEEYGKIGSLDYARQTYCAGEDVRGVINLDMIAWNSADSSPEMDLHALPSVPGSVEISDLFQEVVSTYGINLVPSEAIPVTSASDHASFWRYDYPAILVSEDFADFNPNYHTEDDTFENLEDLGYYTEMVKASLGTLAHMGCLVEGGRGMVSGTVSDMATKLPIPDAHLTLSNPEWGYSFTTSSDQNGYYQFSAVTGWHELTADAFGYTFALQSQVYIPPSQEVQVDMALEPRVETAYFLPIAVNDNPISSGCP